MPSLDKLLRRFFYSVDHMALICQWMTVIALAMIAGLLWALSQYAFPLSVPIIRLSPSQFAIVQEHLSKIPHNQPLIIYRKEERLLFVLENIMVYQNDKMMLTVSPLVTTDMSQELNDTRYVSYRLEVGRHRLFDIVFSKKEAPL